MSKPYKLSQKEFNHFKKKCLLWVDFWGLHEWRINYQQDDSEEDAAGWCMADMANMTAQIAIRKEWPYKPDIEEIEGTAKHEILELLLWPLFDVAVSRDFTMEKCNAARHNVIRRLEYALEGSELCQE